MPTKPDERAWEEFTRYNRGPYRWKRPVVFSAGYAAGRASMAGEVECGCVFDTEPPHWPTKLCKGHKKFNELTAEMADGCLNEIRELLASSECSHGKDHGSTPPMMYAEWIQCVVAHRVSTAVAAERERCAKVVEDHYRGDNAQSVRQIAAAIRKAPK